MSDPSGPVPRGRWLCWWLGLTATLAAGWLAASCSSAPDLAPAPPPIITRQFADWIVISTVDKVDLLFVVDDSPSMGDKQELLERALPAMLMTLIDPPCFDPTTGERTADASSLDGCSSGEPRTRAFRNAHIGIITTSLGTGGGQLCSPESDRYSPAQNGRGRLVARARDGSSVASWNDQGFLAWDPAGLWHEPPAEDDPERLRAGFRDLVGGVGSAGCGFPAPLEAWYRFLIDPEPALDVIQAVDEATRQWVSTPVGIDEVLLAQRAQFLRPDSLLAIVMVTDDDDCSIIDRYAGWLVGEEHEGSMPHATSACARNPNDPCCLSCLQASFPEQCADPRTDPNCASVLRAPEEDPLNLRCFDQKRRFGLNLLQPISRYVRGLTDHEVEARDGSFFPNPLYAPSQAYPRLPVRMDSSLVFLIGIVGVPWQDIATDETRADPEALSYQTTTQINQNGLWDEILGDPQASPPVLPSDPFMIQSVEPRSGRNPRTGIEIEPPRDEPGGNPINGHDQIAVRRSELQYSCIAPLREPRDCADASPSEYCPCKASSAAASSPLCAGTEQRYFGARPAPRILSTLREYGSNAVLGSICPKNPDGAARDPSFGFNPATSPIRWRMVDTEVDLCCAARVPFDPKTGRALCSVLEVVRGEVTPGCQSPGRAPLSPGLAASVERHLRERYMCGTTGLPCDEYSMCEIVQLGPGPELDSCLNDPDDQVEAAGFCYLDGMAQLDRDGDGERHCELRAPEGSSSPPRREDCVGNPELLVDCRSSERRLLRFVSSGEIPLPWPNSMTLITCQGESWQQ